MQVCVTKELFRKNKCLCTCKQVVWSTLLELTGGAVSGLKGAYRLHVSALSTCLVGFRSVHAESHFRIIQCLVLSHS